MAAKIHDLFTSLNYHIFASYHVWIFSTKTNTESHDLEIIKKLELRFSALWPPQRTVYCRGSTVEVSRLMQGWQTKICSHTMNARMRVCRPCHCLYTECQLSPLTSKESTLIVLVPFVPIIVQFNCRVSQSSRQGHT